MSEAIKKEVNIGDCRLILGDCFDLLNVCNLDAAIVSDPPYGMDLNTNTTRFSGGNTARGKGRVRKKIINDDRPFDPSPFLKFSECLLFGANHFWSRLPKGGALVWVKRNDHAFNSFLSDAEIAFLKGCEGVYCHREVIAGSKKAIEAGMDPYGPSAHPTQKPVGLMVWALDYIKSNQVFDPFMGSGTTGVACAKIGRKFTGIEIDPDYFKIACERISRAYEQIDMFVDPPDIDESVQKGFNL